MGIIRTALLQVVYTATSQQCQRPKGQTEVFIKINDIIIII